MAGLLVAATPIITVVLGRFRSAREPLGGSRVAGLLLGLGGVATLAAPELGGDLSSVLEVLLAAGCYAVGSMIAALLDEPLDGRIIVAFALILCGSWLATAEAPRGLQASAPAAGQ